MPFIPHTLEDTEAMLVSIGVASMAALFNEIPEDLQVKEFLDVPAGLSEMQATRLLQNKAHQDGRRQCFIGAGAYEHHIPAAVWDLTTRGEFMTAYTPYQAEASQGTLQLLWEYQTMMASLMGLQVSNASMYDGATALAEAILMAVRLKKHPSPRILLPAHLHPHYKSVLETILLNRGVQLEYVPFNDQGTIPLAHWHALESSNPITAVVVTQPNFFGIVEEVDEVTNWAKKQNALVIGVVNPLAMALLKPPGQWGETGADIACGETQPFGIPLASGGPYAGFLCTQETHVRQMPGRIVGKTIDLSGKRGFTLTLQAREQHIRRSKATSNICTNQGLLVTAATIYMSLLGPEGLKRVALACHQNSQRLKKLITQRALGAWLSDVPTFHEQVLLIDKPIDPVLDYMGQQGFDAGFSLAPYFEGSLKKGLLICVTETKTEADLVAYVDALERALAL